MVHWSKSNKREEVIAKIKLNANPHKYWMGKKRDKKTKEKISEAKKGKPTWSSKNKDKMSEIMKGNQYGKGNIPWNKKYPNFFKCKYCDCDIQNKTGHERKFCNHKCYRSYKKEMKYFSPPVLSGEKSPVWRGGVSFEPYPVGFNNKLKEFIRNRFNCKCQICFREQNKLGYKLHVHHIDFNKENISEENLIPLCRVCHAGLKSKIEESIILLTNKVLNQIYIIK